MFSYSKWNPTEFSLDPSFRLTNYTGLKGWGCKVPRNVLLRLLEGLGDDDQNHNSQVIQGYGFGSPKIGEI